MPYMASFDHDFQNILRVRKEAEAAGKDPLTYAKELLSKKQDEALDMGYVVAALSLHGVVCPLCVMAKQTVCTNPRPTSEEIVRSMQGAWWHGFSVGLHVVSEEDRKAREKFFCEQHLDEMTLSWAAARKGGVGP